MEVPSWGGGVVFSKDPGKLDLGFVCLKIHWCSIENKQYTLYKAKKGYFEIFENA